MTPQKIELHQQSRLLEVSFSEHEVFRLSCEYLRVFSPSAEVKAAKNRGEWVLGKEKVNIQGIEPVGQYAIRIRFDDRHSTGVYSWQTLYELGKHYAENWALHLSKKYRQSNGPHEEALRVLFFAGLVQQLNTEMIEIDCDDSVNKVGLLLQHLGSRGDLWRELLQPQHLQILVNQEFVDADQCLNPGDAVALELRQ